MASTMRSSKYIINASDYTASLDSNQHIPENARTSGRVCTCKNCRGSATRSANMDATGRFVATYAKYLAASFLFNTSRNNPALRAEAQAEMLKVQQAMRMLEGQSTFDRVAAQRRCEETNRDFKRDHASELHALHIMRR